jgi:ribonuclease J
MSNFERKDIDKMQGNRNGKQKKNIQELRVVPLGGLGEIGRNMAVIEYGDDWVIIDSGILFPGEQHPGVDFIIPDFSYIVDNIDKIKAVLITHGHEDHIGAVPYLLRECNVPVYASPLAKGLLESKLREKTPSRINNLRSIGVGQPLTFGAMEVEFFPVAHSIPDATGIAIRTPLGVVVHTGDFKIDHTPVDGRPSDFRALANLAPDGVFLLLSDSTYAEVDGYTPSEQVVADSLDSVIRDAQGRVLIATFASLISRIQMAIDSASRYGRKVAIVGRSMVNNVRIALDLGYLTDPSKVLIDIDRANRLEPNQVIIMTTGSQGEPTSALVRISNRAHRAVRIGLGDTVVISASPIPGNERLVTRTVNNLMLLGATVFYDKNATVHVHGHASKEELKSIISILKPKYFVPVHGERRHLSAHGKIARDLGVLEENVFVLQDGDVLSLTERSAKVVDKVPSDYVYVSGKHVWRATRKFFDDRMKLAGGGVVFVQVHIHGDGLNKRSSIKTVSNGFTEDFQELELLEEAAYMVEKDINGRLAIGEDEFLKQDGIVKIAREKFATFLYNETGKRPTVVPTVINI